MFVHGMKTRSTFGVPRPTSGSPTSSPGRTAPASAPLQTTAVAEGPGTPGDQGFEVSPAFLKFSSHDPSAPPPRLAKGGACTALTPQSSPGSLPVVVGRCLHLHERPGSGDAELLPSRGPWGHPPGRATAAASEQLREPGFRGESPDPQTPRQALPLRHELLGWAPPRRVPGGGDQDVACLCAARPLATQSSGSSPPPAVPVPARLVIARFPCSIQRWPVLGPRREGRLPASDPGHGAGTARAAGRSAPSR